jgi:release factor glutamine methyltransferase
MTIEQWLDAAISKLNEASVPTARLDAEVLLADMLQKDRTWLHAHPDEIIDGQNIQGASLDVLDEQIFRRVRHEPLAYIRGKQEFYGRDFIVSPDTLTPRPETEKMIELLLDQIGDWGLGIGDEKLQVIDDNRKSNNELQDPRFNIQDLQLIDVGTGSGCIIISAALELSSILNPQSSIYYIGLDISESALKVAKRNAKNLKADVDFRKFNLLSGELSIILNSQSSICLLANLPYVPDDFHINLAASHEPKFAIFGGKDGLDLYRKLFEQISPILNPQSPIYSVFTESLPFQHKELEIIAKKAGFRIQKTQDLIQVFTISK